MDEQKFIISKSIVEWIIKYLGEQQVTPKNYKILDVATIMNVLSSLKKYEPNKEE